MLLIIPNPLRFSFKRFVRKVVLKDIALRLCLLPLVMLTILTMGWHEPLALANSLDNELTPPSEMNAATGLPSTEFLHSALKRLPDSGPFRSPDGYPESSSSSRYTYRRPSSGGIGKVYMGREIAGVMSHRGAAWLERPSRRQEEQPWKIINALALRPTDRVVDLGAGTGYMTFQLASAVPDGTVFAVDIQPEMLDRLRAFQQLRAVTNVQMILAEPAHPHVPNDIDCVLMVDAYHEMEYPYEVMVSIVNALNPGGQVVLAEYRGENPLIPIKRLHKMTERQVRRELEAVGLEWIKTEEQLPRQHLIFFQKPPSAASKLKIRVHPKGMYPNFKARLG